MEQNNNNPICSNHKGHVETKCKLSSQEENKLASTTLKTNNGKTSYITSETLSNNKFNEIEQNKSNDLAGPINGGKEALYSGGGTLSTVEDIIPDAAPDKAPFEMIVDFLRDIMKEDYKNALELANQILHFEPTNETVQEYLPVLIELIQIEREEAEEDESSEDETGESDDESQESDSDDDDTGETEDDNETNEENESSESDDSEGDLELQTVDQGGDIEQGGETESESESSSSDETSSSDSDSDASMISPQDFQIQPNLGQINDEINEESVRDDDGYNSESQSGNSEGAAPSSSTESD